MSLPTDDKGRKAIPLYTFLTGFFPDAIVELVRVAVAGNAQHTPGEPLHWARGKSMEQLNTAVRHIFDHGCGRTYDSDPGGVLPAIDFEGKGYQTMHLAKAAWRLLAEIQLLCEARAAPAMAAEDPLPWPVPSEPATLPGCYAAGEDTPTGGPEPVGERPKLRYDGERARCWGCNVKQGEWHGPGCVAIIGNHI